MVTDTAFAIRPLERSPASTALEGAFRVHLPAREQKQLDLTNGDIIRLRSAKEFKGYGVAWTALQTNSGNKAIAKVSDVLREEYSLSLVDTLVVEKANDASKPLQRVEISLSKSSEEINEGISDDSLLFLIKNALADLDLIVPGHSFQLQRKGHMSRVEGLKAKATVHGVEPQPDEKHVFYFNPEITTVILRDAGRRQPRETGSTIFQLDSKNIGGLDDQISIINRELASLTKPLSNKYVMDMPLKRLFGPTSFLLHGPEGTGKSLLLDRIAACHWKQVYSVDFSTKNKAKHIHEIFEDARASQPSLILIDNLDSLLKNAEDLVGKLRRELATIKSTRVVVAAATRSIYDIDPSLQTKLTFKSKIEMFAPNVKHREDTFRKILGPSTQLDDAEYTALAESSHGFVGRDIEEWCCAAVDHNVRQVEEMVDEGGTAALEVALNGAYLISSIDFNATSNEVKPTILRESILEIPKVNWDSIAGVEHAREVLEQMIVEPFKFPDLDVKFGGSDSRKGVLLYGPPGCAKTLIAQAVATESNLNFLAVKGSELIKMYVGESERAIRDVFRQARAAKPCVIFFDEIDSIGKSRDRTQESGLNVVATLLNEMDGIEALKDVFIIGATNRPDILDSALIRTGRFDDHIHIGLPNQEARKQILEIHTRGKPLAADVDFHVLATKTEGSSGADIMGLCSVARAMAKSDYKKCPGNKAQICMRHFEQALEEHVPHTIKEEAERYKNWRPGVSLSSLG